MEKKSSVGKYALVFEPKHVYHQYAVYFTPNGGVQTTKVEKYSFKCYAPNDKSKVKKNTLGEIDKITTSFNNLNDFFATYIDPKIFNYRGDNLHKMFIAYKYNEKMYTLDYILNNPELFKRLQLLDGSKINDSNGRKEFAELILSDENNSFLRFVNKAKYRNETNLSTGTIDIANRLRLARDHESGFTEYNSLWNDFNERLMSYKEYREMFLLRQRYLDYLEEEKLKLQNAKEALISSGQNRLVFDVNIPEYEQLSLFDDEGVNKVMVKGKNK